MLSNLVPVAEPQAMLSNLLPNHKMLSNLLPNLKQGTPDAQQPVAEPQADAQQLVAEPQARDINI